MELVLSWLGVLKLLLRLLLKVKELPSVVAVFLKEASNSACAAASKFDVSRSTDDAAGEVSPSHGRGHLRLSSNLCTYIARQHEIGWIFL